MNQTMTILTKLEKKANYLRNQVLDMCVKAGTGHVSSCFSCIEIMISLYYGGIMKPEDKFILSKGHASPLLYVILADKGIIDKSELDKFCQLDGKLGVHLDHHIPGALITSGSLGIGLGIGAGMALADPKHNIFVLTGDGECAEGSIWEAVMFIGQRGIHNIFVIVDRNKWGVIGNTEQMRIADLFFASGWKIYPIEGHSTQDFLWHYDIATHFQKPTVFIANTIKGKGISFMEDDWHWHGVAPQGELAKKAKDEIST